MGRHTRAIPRPGAGGSKGRAAIPAPGRASIPTALAGSRVTPTPPTTIWARVDRLAAWTSLCSTRPAISQAWRAWSRRQWPSGSSSTGRPLSTLSGSGPAEASG